MRYVTYLKGGRTTFRTKVRLNIKTPSIKGAVKIRVIIIKIIKNLAHEVLEQITILRGTQKASLARQSVTPTLICLSQTPVRSHRAHPR